jgi:hypothetical protein
VQTPILRQIDSKTAANYRLLGYMTCGALVILMIISTLLFNITGGQMMIVYGIFEVVQIVSHLPLVNCSMPGKLVIFLEAFTYLARFDFTMGNQSYQDYYT